MKRSPLAPEKTPPLPEVAGFRLAVAETGIKYKDRPDAMLLLADNPVAAAGTLTRSKTCSAAVDWCRENLISGAARAVLVNAGNANAFTGRAGEAFGQRLCRCCRGGLRLFTGNGPARLNRCHW